MARDMDRWLGNGGMPILDILGAALTNYGDGWVQGSWTPTAEACNPFGTVHAGTSNVVHDALMTFAINAGLERGERSRATLDLHTSYVRSAQMNDPLVLRGDIVRLTRQVAHAEATVTNAAGDVISRSSGTFLLDRPER